MQVVCVINVLVVALQIAACTAVVLIGVQVWQCKSCDHLVPVRSLL